MNGSSDFDLQHCTGHPSNNLTGSPSDATNVSSPSSQFPPRHSERSHYSYSLI